MKVKLDDRQIAEMRRLWAGGALAPDLARKYGITAIRVWHICSPRAFGLPDPRNNPMAKAARDKAKAARLGIKAAEETVTRERDEEIRRLWSEGWSGVELADRYKIARSKVSTIVKGLPRPIRSFGAPVALPAGLFVIPALVVPVAPPAFASTRPIDPADRLWPIEPLRGSAHGRAKLTEWDVRSLRRLKRWGISYAALARRFGISRSNVWYIISGSTWTHVATPGLTANGGTP